MDPIRLLNVLWYMDPIKLLNVFMIHGSNKITKSDHDIWIQSDYSMYSRYMDLIRLLNVFMIYESN